MVEARNNTTLLDKVFKISLVLKGWDGALELVGGILLLVVSPTQLGSVVQFLTQHELSEDPHDVVATTLVHLAGTSSLSGSRGMNTGPIEPGRTMMIPPGRRPRSPDPCRACDKGSHLMRLCAYECR